MNFKKIEINSDLNSTLKTELFFSIASARAEKCELIWIAVPEDKKRFVAYIEKTLKSLKKNGKIQLYVSSGEIKEDLTEARYLRNKYPSLIKECDTEDVAFVVKI